MRKLLVLAVPLLVLGSFGVAQASHDKAVAKTAVCHKVGSKRRPTRGSSSSARSSSRRTPRTRPTSSRRRPACPKTLLSPTSTGKDIKSITVNMLGVAEQPDPADPDGKGTATFRLRQGEGQVCYTLSVSGIGLSTAAHIHKGAVRRCRARYVPLATPNSSGAASGCAKVTARVIVNDIIKNPSAYYVNVHNAEFANGAIRAQLQRPTNISMLVGRADAGPNEKPNAGDRTARGRARS